MAKIKLTKNELKKKKDALKMYKRSLPTFQIKKQQLQMEIRGVEQRLSFLEETKANLVRGFDAWIAVFSEEIRGRAKDLNPLLKMTQIRTSTGNIAGVVIPVFEGAEFEISGYDLYSVPLWVDKALELIKSVLLADAQQQVVRTQRALLTHEVRSTSQRENHCETVKIPETMPEIKRRGIYLGDQQTAQVVRGKISKKKVGEREQ